MLRKNMMTYKYCFQTVRRRVSPDGGMLYGVTDWESEGKWHNSRGKFLEFYIAQKPNFFDNKE